MKPTCIFTSDMPDPTILKVGKYYYLTCSSTMFYPGLIIRRSENLVNWEFVCTVTDEWIGDIWAPELVSHKGKYYIYFPTNNNGHIQVFVTVSDRLDGGWSTPTPIGAEYLIDPGFVTDGNECLLYFNNGYCARLTDDLMHLAEKPYKVWEPWPFPETWKTEGMCAEAPKLFFKNGYYYLLVAEGGTAGPPTSHMTVCFRSKSMYGPWECAPNNPIIHTYSENEEWWSTGHATYFEDDFGRGYFVYHGYKKGNRGLGRQILLCRAEWSEDGFPVAADSDVIAIPQEDFCDDFAKRRPEWCFYRGLDTERYTYGNGLTAAAFGETLAESRPAVLNTRFTDSVTEAVVTAADRSCSAGLTLFYSEKASVAVYVRDGELYTSYLNTEHPWCKAEGNTVYFRITKSDNRVTLAASFNGSSYTEYPEVFDVSGIEHNNYKGFLSLRAGITAFGSGKASFKSFSHRTAKK